MSCFDPRRRWRWIILGGLGLLGAYLFVPQFWGLHYRGHGVDYYFPKWMSESAASQSDRWPGEVEADAVPFLVEAAIGCLKTYCPTCT